LTKRVRVLLATYNGGKYLAEQLRSIQRQTHDNWALTISDDGSSDDTLRIIREFADDLPGRVEVLTGAEPSGSASQNFFRLLASAPPDSSYVALCDQDDIWHDRKLEVLLRECQQIEAAGTAGPCLVYSDLRVVDAELRELSGSFMADMKVRPERVHFGELLVENSIPGCSMLFNDELLQLVQRYSGPTDAVLMHDWWLALLASGCGQLGFVAEPCLSYRQHDSNAAGSVRRGGLRFLAGKIRTLNGAGFRATLAQAKLLQSAYADDVTPAARRVLDAYCHFDELGKLSRIESCLRHGILKQTMLRRLQQLLAI
jgi:glycosyltransferase involved in cell wall biosynthesis